VHVELELRREVSRESVLPRPDQGETGLDPLGHSRHFVIGGIRRDGRNLDGAPAGIVHPGERGRRWDQELFRQVFPDPDDDDPVPRLGDAVILEFVEIRIEPIALRAKVLEDFLEGVAIVRTLEAADVLREEPIGMEGMKGGHPIGVERPISAIKAFLLSHLAKIVAGEAESQGGNGGKIWDVQFVDVLADDGGRLTGANIPSIRLASRGVEIVGPLMTDFPSGVPNVRVHSPIGEAARAAK